MALYYGLIFALVLGVTAQNAPFPVVDLSVSLHQATLNATGQYYTFSNIPYAQPPVGDLRFRRSVAPQVANRTVDNGQTGRICPQATPKWQKSAASPVAQPTHRGNPPVAAVNPLVPAASQPVRTPSVDPRESEDCLLLDVMVPKIVFDAAASTPTSNLKPVMVWFHGGNFVQGSKNEGNPARLLQKSISDGRGGIVYVQINYRLGLFGFPPAAENDTDIDPNAGLYDQQLALQWIQDNIPLFGGDPNEVTVIGESSGAASILHQITAFGTPRSTGYFKRAVLQSPAMRPASDKALYALVLQELIVAGNISSLSDARDLSTEQLQSLNAITVGSSPFATFTYGPTVDDDFVPMPPTVLLDRGRFDNDLEVVVSHNSNEGLLFADPKVQDQTAMQTFLTGLLPAVDAKQIGNILTRMYPANFSGTFGYTTQTERLALILSDSMVTCNGASVFDAFDESATGYLFSMSPGVHAQDVAYTFFNGESVDSTGTPINHGIADYIQTVIVNFALSSKRGLFDAVVLTGPQALPNLPLSHPRSSMLNITEGPFSVVPDPGRSQKCEFWQTDIFKKRNRSSEDTQTVKSKNNPS